MSNINADAPTDAMAAALTDAAGDLEAMANENLKIQHEFEAQRWDGLDILSSAATRINTIRDSLVDVADKIGVGGQIVRDARLNNHMITHATKESLGQA
ncbi:hypothetical protein [Amycolatopsis thermoflava]|uniref:hypothetical protein n=1 Tax=Amycolatopsis thermoflava TaxID=84480 RepID=UPI003D72A8B0